jgi:hypothetical protein
MERNQTPFPHLQTDPVFICSRSKLSLSIRNQRVLENPYGLISDDLMKIPGTSCQLPTPRTDGLSTASLNCHGVAQIKSGSIRGINERTNAFLGPITIKAFN